MAQAKKQANLTRTYLTTGDLAVIWSVSMRSITKWFDAGLLKGYRLPCVGPGRACDRRIPQEEAVRFALAHGLPLPPELTPAVAAEAVTLLLTDGAATVAAIREADPDARRAASLYHLGRQVEAAGPRVRCVVIDLATAGTSEGLRVAQSLAMGGVPVVVLHWEAVSVEDLQPGVTAVEMPTGLAALAGVVCDLARRGQR